MKRLFSFAAALLLTAVCFAQSPAQVRAQADSAQVIELEAYCSARYEKDAQIWAMSVNAIDENLYTNFFIKDNVEPLLVELPQAGTYSTGRGNLTFNYAHINRTELEVDSIVITLANTMPVGALNADMMMYLTDGTIYHLIAEPTCEGISGTDSLDFQYGDVRIFQSDPGAQMQIVQLLATIENYTYAITFKNTTLATLPGTYGDGDWQELLTAVSYLGYESETTYEWPCSVSAVVDETTAHVVMHMWDGVEYTLNFHYAEAHPQAQALLYNGSQAIELVEGENAENDVNHMDSLVITFSGFSPADNLELRIAKPNDSGIDVVDLIPRGNNRYVAAYSLDFIRNTGEWTRYLLTIYDPVAEAFFLYKIVNNEPIAAQALLYNGSQAIELVEGENAENDVNHMDSLVITFSGFSPADNLELHIAKPNDSGIDVVDLIPRGNNRYVAAYSLDFIRNTGEWTRYLLTIYDPVAEAFFLYKIVNNEPAPEPTAHALLYNGGEAIELVEYCKPEREVNCANHMDSLVVMLSDFDSVDEVAFSFYDHNFWGSQDRTMTPRGNNVYAVAFPQDFFKGNPTDLRYEIRVIVNPYSHTSFKSFSYFIYNDGTAIELVEQKSAPAKTLRNGHLVISVGDAEYTVDGTQLK